MSDSEKMNALDFVISVLKEHEGTLDSLIEKLEDALKSFPSAVPATQAAAKVKPAAKANIKVTCENWNEFKDACSGAETVSFHLDNNLRIKALQGNIIYSYQESIQKHTEIMECGISVRFHPDLDPSNIRRSLAKDLNVIETRIIQGDIEFS